MSQNIRVKLEEIIEDEKWTLAKLNREQEEVGLKQRHLNLRIGLQESLIERLELDLKQM